MPLLSIVIPAFNEANRLREGVTRVLPVIEQLGEHNIELIVVDDGSTDDTLKVAGECYGNLPSTLFIRRERNTGKGAAVALGIGVANGEFVIIADADMAIDPSAFPHMIHELYEVNVAPGDRSRNGDIRYESFLRTLSGYMFHLLVRRYSGVLIRDTQCGCKGFQLGTARLLALLGYVERFAFDVEWLYLANKLHCSISPVPVEWRDVSESSIHLGSDSRQMLKDIRGITKNHYENPAVVLPANFDIAEIKQHSHAMRVQGLVVARNGDNDILVFPRDAGLVAIELATVLQGEFRLTNLDELKSRQYVAV